MCLSVFIHVCDEMATPYYMTLLPFTKLQNTALLKNIWTELTELIKQHIHTIQANQYTFNIEYNSTQRVCNSFEKS